ncbi:MAG: DUF6476 family protein [Rhodobacteraceae bacterium]|nr:DUF6476 family protein [Paracoccaceae bacterium]
MDAPVEEPKNLRLLRRLVMVLTVVMIGGLLTIVAVIVMQFARTGSPGTELTLPAEISLPDNESAQAVTFGRGWIAVVTIDGDDLERIHIYSSEGTPRQTIKIEPAK